MAQPFREQIIPERAIAIAKRFIVGSPPVGWAAYLSEMQSDLLQCLFSKCRLRFKPETNPVSQTRILLLVTPCMRDGLMKKSIFIVSQQNNRINTYNYEHL